MSTAQKEKADTTKAKKKKKITNQVANETPVKPQEEVKDTSSNLPKKIADRKIVCKELGVKGSSKVELSDIKSTSQQVYVDDIHHANPTALQTIYWLIMPNTRHVVARVTKEEYEYVMKKKPNINHLISYVDCSVYPTLTYGSWQVDEIQGDFPSATQIKEQEARFKHNTAMFHNPPVKIDIVEDDVDDNEEEEDFDFEEEEFDFDFEGED